MRYLIFVVIISGLTSCKVGNTKSSNNLDPIRLSYKMDLVNPQNGQTFSPNASLIIIYKEDFIIYRLPVYYQRTKGSLDNDGNVKNDILLDSATVYNYILYKKNEQYGLVYDSLSVIKARKVSIDSLLNSQPYKKFPFNPGNLKLIKADKKEENKILIEKYIPTIKVDDSYGDTLYYYYNKRLVNVNYSFSKELDSIKKTKLYKVKFIFNPIPNGKYPFPIPKREYIFQLEKLTNVSSQEMDNLIARFKKDKVSIALE